MIWHHSREGAISDIPSENDWDLELWDEINLSVLYLLCWVFSHSTWWVVNPWAVLCWPTSLSFYLSHPPPICLLFLHHQRRQETERTWVISSHHDDTQGSPSSNLLLPAKPHILKVLQPLKSIPPAREQVFKQRSSPDTSHSNHIREEKPTCQQMLKGKKLILECLHC